jgi:two-component system, OmpR family, response regulator QseB
MSHQKAKITVKVALTYTSESQKPMHILMLEDDLDLGRTLLSALKLDGFTAEWVRRAGDAPPLELGDSAINLILLDLGLPDGEGMNLLMRWRKNGITIPIIVITARSGLDQKLEGLNGGADDFLVKPFAPAELVSRIRAVMRRYALQSTNIWRVGTLEIEPRAHQVRSNGADVSLSPREFNLLVELARNAHTIVPKGQLAQCVEPLGAAIDFASLEVHLSNLRRKIGSEKIRTIRGIGYQLYE